MPYKFTFDLSRVPRFFFTEMATVTYQTGMGKTVIQRTKELIIKFRIQEATGLNLTDSLAVIQDLIDLQGLNLMERNKFLQSKRRAVFLPHCARKYLDNRCKATFDPNIPSFTCEHCSEDCLISQASKIAGNKGYDIYVVPGGSCIPKIVKKTNYEGIVGVACGEEIKLFGTLLEGIGVAGQAIPLLKNGCANTIFSIETLAKVL